MSGIIIIWVVGVMADYRFENDIFLHKTFKK